MDDTSRSQRRRRHAALLVVALAVVAVAVLPAAGRADSISDAQRQLQQVQNQLNQANGALHGHEHQAGQTSSIIASLQAQLTRFADRETQLRALVAQLDQEVAAQQAAVDASQHELDRVTAALRAAQDQLARDRAHLAADRAVLADEVKLIYESPATSTVNALLSSDNFDELYQKYIDEHRVAASYQQMADAVNREAARVQDQVAQISADKAHQADVLKGQQAHRQVLGAARDAQVQAKADLDQVIAQDQQALAQNQQAEQQIQQEIAGDQAALTAQQQALVNARGNLASAQAAAAAAAERSRGGSGGGPSGYGGTGRFGWPEPNDGISQGFGCTPYAAEPYDPNCPSLHFHSGIDIADPWGTPIQASDTGVVHLYSSAYGYGMHIIMAHGNGFSTVFGHLSSFAVGDGSFVTRGTVIGYEGSTGNSSGPHLHFEIREGQTPVNPLAFLS